MFLRDHGDYSLQNPSQHAQVNMALLALMCDMLDAGAYKCLVLTACNPVQVMAANFARPCSKSFKTSSLDAADAAVGSNLPSEMQNAAAQHHEGSGSCRSICCSCPGDAP